ncbi:hypothetical protein THRCLA_22570, partial [Thraustotheca clavata]
VKCTSSDAIRQLSLTRNREEAMSSAEYQASRAHTVQWIARAKKGLAVRTTSPVPAGPTSFFHRFAHNYGVRHVHSNTFAPFVHMMLIIAGSGMAIQYLGRHRHKKAAKEASCEIKPHSTILQAFFRTLWPCKNYFPS